MVVTVFRTTMLDGADEGELADLGERMHVLACAMPGFISYKDFAAADGESLSLIEFESPEALLAWREHPEHKAAQERGRVEFFQEYRIQVLAPMRDYSFKRETLSGA